MQNPPIKSSLSNEIKPSRSMMVRFQLDDVVVVNPEREQKTGLTRKQCVESSPIHEIQPWSIMMNALSSMSNSSTRKADSSSALDSSFLNEVAVHSSTDRTRSSVLKQRDSHSNQLTFCSLTGTMSQINHLLTHTYSLGRPHVCKASIRFIDSCLRAIGQVMFANNPLSGFLIVVALSISDCTSAFFALFGTMISTLTAHLLGLNSSSIQTGLYGSNGCLTALIISHFSFGQTFMELLAPVIFFSICSTIFFVGFVKIFVIRFDLSPFVISSQLCSLIWFFIASSSPSFINFVNETSNTSTWSSVTDTSEGFLTGISHAYFVSNVLTGVLILIGVAICSPRLALLALFGSITGQLSAVYLFQIGPNELRSGLWAFNSVMTCQTLGGMFFVLHGFHIWFVTLFGSILTVMIHKVFSELFCPLMFPSLLVCWSLCLLGGSSRYLIGVQLRSISLPEDHLRRFRLSNLVKKHFQFFSHLSVILDKVGVNENIFMEDSASIEAEFVPILLCSYAHQNDLVRLHSLLNEGADVNSTDYDLRSPLHLAACDGNLKLSRLLIESFRANPNQSDDFGGTPLYDAFCHGHFHLIPYLYTKGARMPTCKMKELTFLLCAFASEGNLDAVQYLIASGINPNLTDHNGRTALHLAVCENHVPVVQYLVEEANISLSIRDYYGRTASDEALRLSEPHIAFYLQHRRVDPPIHSKKVFHLFNDIDDDIDMEEPLDNDEFMVRNSLLSTEESLLPALFCTAAGEGNVRQMVSILKQFPQFRADSVDYDFRSAAHIAAAEGQLASVQFLCQHAQTKKLDLHWINREDRWGFTPIEEAYRNGHTRVAEYLQQYQSKDPTSIQLQTGQNSTLVTKSFVDSIRKWKKVLRFAALVSNNEADLIRRLLNSGILSSSERYADYDGRTPMHWAALNGYLNVVKVLQQCGDDGRTHKDRWNNSAFDEAKRKKFTQIVNVLQDDIV